ncbi:MAG: gamma-glutamylcyclotransferase family protein [Chitinivibrionales bacterium]
MCNLFVYGTLLSKAIWKSIVTGDYASDSAVLKGYARKKVKGKNYPGLIEQAGSEVEGMIHYNISEEDFRKLDIYEGKEYERTKVFVQLLSGKSARCITYLFKKEYFNRLTESEWSPEKSK